MVELAGCPNCGADYPDFHSPVGTIETVCDACGWASDEDREHEDVRLIHRHRMTGPHADQTDDEFWQDIVKLAVCPGCRASRVAPKPWMEQHPLRPVWALWLAARRAPQG